MVGTAKTIIMSISDGAKLFGATLLLSTGLTSLALAQTPAAGGHGQGQQYVPQMNDMKGATLNQPGAEPGVPTMTPAEFDEAKGIFFDKCAG